MLDGTIARLFESAINSVDCRAECNEHFGPMHSALCLLRSCLLIASLRHFLRNCRQIAKQAGGLLDWTGREVDLRRRCSVRIEIARANISGCKRPDALDDERLAVCILQ